MALEEDYQEGMAADDAPATVVVRRASGQGYFRAHPTFFRNVRMLEIKNGDKTSVTKLLATTEDSVAVTDVGAGGSLQS